jgi:DegV family protein with EDD domain
MNHKIALLTDSTCDIPAEYIDKYQIGVIPLTIIWGDDQFRDGIDINAEDFYKRLDIDPLLPTTSQPTPQEMLTAYQAAQSAGAEEILIVTISSAMSGTHESARAAATMMDLPVRVLDSKANSMSLGWQVLAAARAREGGGDLQSMIDAAEQARSSMVYIITLDTLEYLHKGGRIGGASHFIGNLLNLKPQITVNHISGEVEGGRRSRTRKRALSDLYEDFFSQIDSRKTLHIAVLHNAAQEEAQFLADKIQSEYQPEEMLLSIVSPILGVHTGPRAVAICGYVDSDG